MCTSFTDPELERRCASLRHRRIHWELRPAPLLVPFVDWRIGEDYRTDVKDGSAVSLQMSDSPQP